MRFVPTPLAGLFVLEMEWQRDQRGAFGRSFCRTEFLAAGIAFEVAQANTSVNDQAATLRGLHYQTEPHGEAKLVQCTRGRIFDVAVDLRPGSPTHAAWFGIELEPDALQSMFIPPGFAHGFLTLEPVSEVAYLMGTAYAPGAGRGVRWDDPAFGIAWPIPPEHMSQRDADYADYTGVPC